MDARDAEIDPREPNPEYSHLFPTSISVSSKTSAEHSLSNDQSALRTRNSSSSTNSRHHLRNNSAIVISTPLNTTIPRPSDTVSAKRPVSSPSTPSYSLTPTYSTKQPGGLGFDPKSPSSRRQPASRSSHGIETSTGPPPALITQRSYTTDSAWKQHNSLDGTRHSKYRPDSQESVDLMTTDERNAAVVTKATSTVRRRPEMAPEKASTMASTERRHREHDKNRDSTLRNFDPVASSNLDLAASAKQSGHATLHHVDELTKSSQEDLFLILARSNSLADNAKDISLKGERRRSRMNSFPNRNPHRSLSPGKARPASSGRLFAGHAISPSQDSTLSQWGQSKRLTESVSPPFAKRTSPRERRYAMSAHPLEHGRPGSQSVLAQKATSNVLGTRSGSNRETSPELLISHGHRQSVRESSPCLSSRAHKLSNLAYSTNGYYGPLPFPDSVDPKRPQIPHADGTASTVSTTAPSTIWDDVEDLKHRMRKLELTGKLPLTSEAAISNVFSERPPTATTTMTTISSSPKFNHRGSVSPSTVRGTDTTEIHPLLHSALAKSRPVIEPGVFRALEATASDALVLVAMTAAGGSQAAPSVTGVDRRFRRKADSMCRSLTELCIALTQGKSERVTAHSQTRTVKGDRIVSINHNVESGPGPRYLRASSEDPEMRSSSRHSNRFEVRRASVLQFAPPMTHRDVPPEANIPTQEKKTTISPSTTSRLDRPSTLLRRKAPTSEAPDVSPSSRSLTETSYYRSYPSSAERAQREYTSQQRLPTPTQHSTSVQSSLPVRREYFSTTASSPTTSSVKHGSRRYLDRGTTPPLGESARAVADIRRERMAAVGSQSREKRITG